MVVAGVVLGFGFAGTGCGDDGGAATEDMAVDAPDAAEPLPDPPTFEVVPDPDVLTGCEAEIPGPGEVRAKRVACPEELPQGALVMGREGDIVLSNSQISVVIRTGTEAATLIGAYPGGIIDAARHGEPDLLQEAFVSLDLSIARPSDIVITAAGADGVARVEVPFEIERLEVISAALGGLLPNPPAFGLLRYELHPDESTLRVEVQFAAEAGTRVLAAQPGLVARAAGAARAQLPGAGVLGDDVNSGDAEDSAGFVGMLFESPETALGFRIASDEGSASRIAGVYLTQSARILAPAGEAVTVAAELALGATAAEVHALLTAGDELEEVTLSGAEEVEIRLEDEFWLRTRLSPGENPLRVPAGSRSYVPGFERYYAAEVNDDAGAVVELEPAPVAILEVDATAEGEALPVRVTGVRDGEEILRRVVRGTTAIRLPPGPLSVTLSRGYEYDLHQQDVDLETAAPVQVTADLPRVVDTTGWVAGDFHLHTEMSTDSTHPVADAVRILAGEGIEVAASTDHDFITDYGPELQAAELDGLILAVPGVEASDPILAHVGGYPLVRDPDRAGFGAPVWFPSDPTALFGELRALGDESLGGAIVQLNHPYRGRSGWLKAIALDPMTGMATVTPTEIGIPADAPIAEFDWDVVEVFNDGAGSQDEETLAAFLGLWENGWRFGMVGNSDSHDPGRPGGSTRTLVRVPDDAPGAYAWGDIAAAFAAREMTVSGGAFVEATLEGVAGDTATIRVRVQAPPYVELDRLRVYAGSATVLDQAIPASSEVVRVDETLDVELGGATFFMVRADGPRGAPPVLPFAAFGATNPILVE